MIQSFAFFGQPTHAKEELGKDAIQLQLAVEFAQAIERVATMINDGE